MYKDKINHNPSCHIWTGAVNHNGYGVVKHEGKLKRVHRVIYEQTNGKIPDKMVLNHLCRVRNCVNIEHLEVTTNKHNVLTGTSGSAINAAKTHCINGHEFDTENTYITPRGWRVCRTCTRKQQSKKAL